MSESFKDKLINFETPPPPAVWDKISEDLIINKESLLIANKLFDYEELPPLQTWEAIKTSIHSDVNKPQNLIIVKRRKFLSYSMMAAAILGAVLTVLSLLNKKEVSSSKSVIGQIADIKSQKIITADTSIEKPIPSLNTPEIEEIADVPVTTIAKTHRNHIFNKKPLQNTKVKSSLYSGFESGIMIAAKPIRNSKGEIIQNTGILNKPGSKYISITSPSGQQTKISSKFLHMLLFINDDNDIDQVESYFDKNFLESLIWKSRFQEWRNQIISTSFVPSSTNFMDILDFRDLIMKDN